jgi:hypothetical protein
VLCTSLTKYQDFLHSFANQVYKCTWRGVTPYDGQSFSYLGELTQYVATVVHFHMNGFRIIFNVLTKSRDYMVTLLDELTTNGFPSCDVDDEEATATSTRE